MGLHGTDIHVAAPDVDDTTVLPFDVFKASIHGRQEAASVIAALPLHFSRQAMLPPTHSHAAQFIDLHCRENLSFTRPQTLAWNRAKNFAKGASMDFLF